MQLNLKAINIEDLSLSFWEGMSVKLQNQPDASSPFGCGTVPLESSRIKMPQFSRPRQDLRVLTANWRKNCLLVRGIYKITTQ